MSIEDYFNDYDYGESEEDSSEFYKECNRCGKSGLKWEETDSGWVLIDKTGRIHKCNAKPKTVEISLDKKI